METYIFIMEIIGSIAFAVSGAIQAIRHKLDIFGVAVLGLVTAVGGGIIRDIVIGDLPPKMFRDPTCAIIAMITALAVFLFAPRAHHAKWAEKVLYVADSIGLAVFTAVGVESAYELGHTGLPLMIFVGVITGVGGGVLRDVFTGTVPYIFRKHIYATASLAGVLAIWLCAKFLDYTVAMAIGAILIVIIRLFAILFHLNLPKSQEI